MPPKKKSGKKQKGGKKKGSSPNRSNDDRARKPSKSSNAGLSLVVLLFSCLVGIFGALYYRKMNNEDSRHKRNVSKKQDDERTLYPHHFYEASFISKPQDIQESCFNQTDGSRKCYDLRPWNKKKKKRQPDNCKDSREDCRRMARSGGCDRNPGWMTVYCARSCFACELRDVNIRCNRDDNIEPVLKGPGDVAKRFEGLEERYPELEPRILSKDPYLAVFDRLMTPSEADHFQYWLKKLGPKRSTTQTNEWDENGVMKQAPNQVRTSSNAWCTSACWNDPIIRRVTERIANITGAHPRNFEEYQMVHYEKGQYYRTHSDCNPSDRQSTQTAGHRIFTFFIYLNDVEEGGATDFPKLGHKVFPKKGSAAFWPDVKNSDPTNCDYRFDHHATDVIKGVKMGANVWIHNYDYKTASHWGCTGSFSG